MQSGTLVLKRGGFGRKRGFRALVVVEDLAGEGVVGESGGLAGLGVGETLALAVENQLGVVDEGHAVGVGKLLGAGADEVNVGALFEDQAGGLDGVAEALDAGHAAGFHAAAVHEQGVELDAAVGGEKAAAAGVEGGVVFEDGDGGFDGIEGRAAEGKDGVAGFKGAADTGLVGGCIGGGDGPCAAVDEKSGDVRGGGGHRNMVEHFAGKRRIPPGVCWLARVCCSGDLEMLAREGDGEVSILGMAGSFLFPIGIDVKEPGLETSG